MACENSAIFKCLDAGYKPWQLGETSFPSHLQACVRMIRADYYGNGAPWTVNGRTIDVWDDLGIQTRSQPWPVEAEWTAHGARCVRQPRVVFVGQVPPCVLSRIKLDCGAGAFRPGVHLMDAPESTGVDLGVAGTTADGVTTLLR